MHCVGLQGDAGHEVEVSSLNREVSPSVVARRSIRAACLALLSGAKQPVPILFVHRQRTLPNLLASALADRSEIMVLFQERGARGFPTAKSPHE